MQYDNPLAEKEAIELQLTAGRLSAKSSHIPLYISWNYADLEPRPSCKEWK